MGFLLLRRGVLLQPDGRADEQNDHQGHIPGEDGEHVTISMAQGAPNEGGESPEEKASRVKEETEHSHGRSQNAKRASAFLVSREQEAGSGDDGDVAENLDERAQNPAKEQADVVDESRKRQNEATGKADHGEKEEVLFFF